MPHALQGQEVSRALALAALLTLSGGAAGLSACAGASSETEPVTVDIAGDGLVLKPAPSGARPPSSASRAERVTWLSDVATARREAARRRRPLLIFAGADWAVPSRQMDRRWKDPEVVKMLHQMVVVRLDLTAAASPQQVQAERLGIEVVPALIIERADGQRTQHVGTLTTVRLLELLHAAFE